MVNISSLLQAVVARILRKLWSRKMRRMWLGREIVVAGLPSLVTDCMGQG